MCLALCGKYAKTLRRLARTMLVVASCSVYREPRPRDEAQRHEEDRNQPWLTEAIEDDKNAHESAARRP